MLTIKEMYQARKYEFWKSIVNNDDTFENFLTVMKGNSLILPCLVLSACYLLHSLRVLPLLAIILLQTILSSLLTPNCHYFAPWCSLC